MFVQLKLRTEYSFKTAYGPIDQVIAKLKAMDCHAAAITDRSSTFGHVNFNRLCKQNDIKPIFGVELAFTPDVTVKEKRQELYWLSLLARNNAGLQEIYATVEEATSNFHYVPRLPITKLHALSQDILILSGNCGIGPHNNKLPQRVVIEAHSATSLALITDPDRVRIPVSDNFMITPDNRDIYEILVGRNAFTRPSPMHILTHYELVNECRMLNNNDFRFANALANECNAILAPATNIKALETKTLLELCIEGAQERNLPLLGDYRDRMQYELSLIETKGFNDYFKVIADMVRYAKTQMLVGPARGSSCGSLVCYLLGITDIDPIPHKLIFERFIDVTREDLPDVDLDFADDKRDLVFDYLIKKYGKDKVARLGTISRYKARSAIGETAKAIRIPHYESEQIADNIIKRNDGDDRSDNCIADTFNETDVGQAYLAKYPNIIVASKLEAHSRHSGTHAAGIVITNEPINHYVSRDVRNNTIHLDKYDAEKINLMKIDALGLGTLTVIADCLEQIGWNKQRLLAHPLDDDKAFQVLRDYHFCGIFQFAGTAVQSLARQIHIDRFADMVALIALPRPGPLVSGAAYEWCARRMGRSNVQLLHTMMESITGDTYGLIVYQEQMLRIIREIGGLSWEDCAAFRRGINKKLGMEYFDAQWWEKFKSGAHNNGIDETLARQIWETVNGAGGYCFNLCIAGTTKVRLATANPHVNQEITLNEYYERFYNNRSASIRKRDGKNIVLPKLISLFPDGRCYPQRPSRIICNYEKEVYDYTFDNGTVIRCTKEHRFIINGEWKSIENANIGDKFLSAQYENKKNVSIKQNSARGNHYGIYQEGFPSDDMNPSWQNGRTMERSQFRQDSMDEPCTDCGKFHNRMEVHHIDENAGKDQPDNLVWLCPGCHKKRHYASGRTKQWEKGHETIERTLVSIEYVGEEITYDIEMPEHHNFVLEGGIITHNSHAVAYGMVAYWCAVLKAHHPLQFALATLKYTADPLSIKQYLRELDRSGYSFKPYDAEKSELSWSVKGNELLGGITNIIGVGPVMANEILFRRKNDVGYTIRQEKLLTSGKTKFDDVFEVRTKFKHLLAEPKKYGIVSKLWQIADIDIIEGNYVFIAKVISFKVRSLNEMQFLIKRNNMRVLDDKWLTMVLEDDSGIINATISRKDFPRFGLPITKEYRNDQYFLFRGFVKQGNRRVYIEKFRAL